METTNNKLNLQNYKEFKTRSLEFNSNQVRVIIDKCGKVWFVAKDVAEVLGYTNPQKAIRDHCKGVNDSLVPSTGGAQSTKVIPEPDVYRLIIRSKLPTAERFQKWVFEEVLPSIRKTGAYHVNSDEVWAQILANPIGVGQMLIEYGERLKKKPM